MVQSRLFSAHGHGPAPKAPNGLAEVIQHPTGKPDHHHEHIKTAGLDHKFIIGGVNKRFLVFDGLRGTQNLEVQLDN